MHKALLFMLVVAQGSVVFAQTTAAIPPQRDSDAEMISAQKRIELRNMLSAAGRRTESTAQAEQGEPAGRQLSQQERAEMREQLRRQSPVAPRAQRP